MIGGAIANVINAGIEMTPYAQTETFESRSGVGGSPVRMALVSIMSVTVVFLLVLFAGKYLWNNVLSALVPAVKPAKSVWQILGLAVLISLLAPGSCACAM
jgi:hypothetical protein